MNEVAAIMLYIVIGTNAGNIRHGEPMPDLKTCLDEASKFLRHQLPEAVDANSVGAGCSIKVANIPS